MWIGSVISKLFLDQWVFYNQLVGCIVIINYVYKITRHYQIYKVGTKFTQLLQIHQTVVKNDSGENSNAEISTSINHFDKTNSITNNSHYKITHCINPYKF